MGLKVDIKIENKPDIVADCHSLPFKDGVFDAVLADPPYNNDYARRLYQTPRIKMKQYIKEMVRVAKAGAVIAIYHLIKISNPENCRYLGVITIVTRSMHHARIVNFFQKEGEFITLDAYQS